MRNLRINKQTITYQNPTGTITDVLNGEGLKTGQRKPVYETAASLDINIRINRGNITLQDFGISSEWDGIMETSDMDCPLVEGSVITYSGKKFMLSRMDKSLNGLRYYLTEVK